MLIFCQNGFFRIEILSFIYNNFSKNKLMRLTLFIVLTLICSTYSFTQTNIGIGVDLFESTLYGTARGETGIYGFSGSPHTVEKTIGVSLDVLFQSKLTQRLEVEYGVGYFYENERIQFEGPFFLGEEDVLELNIDLYYLELPIQANYIFYKNNHAGSVLGMIGLSPKILVMEDDNYQNIIFQKILITAPYNRFLLNGHVAIGFRQMLPKGRYAELIVYQGADLTAFSGNGWGFYNDLHTARNLQLGVKLRYFFSTKHKKG
jgi:hypothetical protein